LVLTAVSNEKNSILSCRKFLFLFEYLLQATEEKALEADLLTSSDHLCPDLFLLASGQPDPTPGTGADNIPEMLTIQRHSVSEMLESQPINLPEMLTTSQKDSIPGMLASPAVSLPDVLLSHADSISEELDSGNLSHTQQHTSGNKVNNVVQCVT
jgi:hypothetical protein